ALAQKFRAGTTRINDSSFATASGHGCDARQTLYVGRSLVTGAICAKSHEQPRGQCGSSSRQMGEQLRVGMILKDFLNLLIVSFDDGMERLNDLGMPLAQTR